MKQQQMGGIEPSDLVPIVIEFAIGLGKWVAREAAGWFSARRDVFLNYAPAFLMTKYESEIPIAPGVPYTEICNWLTTEFDRIPSIGDEVDVHVDPKRFVLAQGSETWASLRDHAFAALVQSGRISKDTDESIIRLREGCRDGERVQLKAQKAKYHDQAKSNLVLDWHHTTDSVSGTVTLRDLLSARYGTKLPRLSDGRLANSVGVACLVYYKDEGDWVPYLVRRVKQVGVFPGGLHCSASGIANWPPGDRPASFDSFFVRPMYL